MDTELYNSIRKAVSDGIGSPMWLMIFSSLLFGGLGAFFGAMLKKHGENLAANQNFKKVLDQLEAQTKITEEIKGEFAKQTAITTEKIKAAIAKQTTITTQKQTRWSPLLGAARNLQVQLDKLTKKYKVQPPENPWEKRKELPLYARDFCELYFLDENPEPIDNWLDREVDPGAVREEGAVKWVRRRMQHETATAEISLYWTAKYLGYAERVRRELEQGQLICPKEERKEIINLLLKVRNELNGTSKTHPGSGIIFERQETIGESVWDKQADCVISDDKFRDRLLRSPDWEEFIELFRFFVDFHMKVDTEVQNTSNALKPLCDALERVCFSESSN